MSDKQPAATSPCEYRKKPVVIKAHRWYQNGDHPDDACEPLVDQGTISKTEGKVVRYFRHPSISGTQKCSKCGFMMYAHGWIDTLEDGHNVCPGDWIITGVKGERYPCKPDIFEATYEPASTTPSESAATEQEPCGWRWRESDGPYKYGEHAPSHSYAAPQENKARAEPSGEGSSGVPATSRALPNEPAVLRIIEAALLQFPQGYDEYGVYFEWKEQLDKALEPFATRSASATPLDETFFWPIGFINHDGGVTWEPGREPGEHAPGKLVYIVREQK